MDNLTGFSIWSALAIIPVQGMVMAVIYARELRGRRDANRSLAAFLFVVSLNLGDHILQGMGQVARFPGLYRLAAPFAFLLGPFLLSYVRASVAPAANVAPELAPDRRWHLLPALVYFLYLLPFYTFGTAAKAAILVRGYIYVPGDDRIWDLAINLHIAAYIACSWSALAGRYRQLRVGAPAQRKKLLTLAGIMVLCTVFIALILLKEFLALKFDNWLLPSGSALVLCVVSLLRLVDPAHLVEEIETLKNNYAKSGLSEQKEDAIVAKLKEAMSSHRQAFLDPAFSLADLAATVGAKPHHVSQVINKRFQKNFFGLVNGIRVAESLALLQDPARKDSVLDVAMKMGFNSKSAFYRAFKAETGKNPGEYFSD